MNEQARIDKDALLSQPKYKLIIEKDVKIPMRDGDDPLRRHFPARMRPRKFPVLINIGIYQKDKLWVPPRRPRGEAQSRT